MQKNPQRKGHSINRILKGIVMTSAIAFLVVFFALIPAKVVLADGTVTLGSNSYSPQGGSDFNIGVYIDKTDETAIGDYSITFTYDPNVMTYVSGAESGGNGQIVVAGRSADGGRSQHMLTFRAADGGNTGFTAAAAAINDAAGNPMTVGALPSAPINVQERRPEPPSYVRINGKDVPGLTEGRTEYTFSVDYAEAFNIEVPDGYTLTHNANSPVVGRNNIEVKVFQNNVEVATYQLHVNMLENKNPEPQPEPKSEEPKSEVTSEKEVTSEEAGEDVNSRLEEAVEIPSMDPIEERKNSLSNDKKAILVLAVFIVGIVAVIGIKLLFDSIMMQRGKRSDLKMLSVNHKLEKQEKIDEKANPFEYEDIGDFKGKVVTSNSNNAVSNGGIVMLFNDRPGEAGLKTDTGRIDTKQIADSGVDLRLSKSVENGNTEDSKAEAGNAESVNANAANTETGNNDSLIIPGLGSTSKDANLMNQPLPKLDFHHRKSAGEIARNLQKEERKTIKDADEDYMDAMDAIEAMNNRSVVEDDDSDFIDLEDMVSDRDAKPVESVSNSNSGNGNGNKGGNNGGYKNGNKGGSKSSGKRKKH